MRLFLGTFLEKELIEAIPLGDIQKLFEGDLKSITCENIHLTWIFLGEVTPKYEIKLKEIIEGSIDSFKNLTFTSKGIELWPPKKFPRLIVITGELNKNIDLTSLNSDLKTICNPDIKRDFISHITIARFKKDKTIKTNTKLPQLKNFTWDIKEISLVKSTLSSDGPSYTKINNWTIK